MGKFRTMQSASAALGAVFVLSSTAQSQSVLFDFPYSQNTGGIIGCIFQQSGVQWIGAAGDVDGDGFDDYVVGASSGAGRAIVYSGRSGTALRTLTGDPYGSEFDRSVGSAGDVDADGVPDVVVGGAGEARLFSGADGTLLLARPNPMMRALGDVDADGHADLAVESGILLSGANFAVLANTGSLTHRAYPVGDVNANGSDDIAIADLFRVSDGQVLDFFSPPTASHEWTRGAGCAGSNGNIRRITSQGRANLGGSVQVRLRGGRPTVAAALLIGSPASLPLAPIGAPACSLFVNPLLSIGSVTNRNGVATIDFGLATNLAPVGTRLELQWALWDPSANSLGVSTSDALALKVGR